MAILVANTGSVTTVSGSWPPVTPARWTWLGLVTGAGTSGCVSWLMGPCATGSLILPIVASPMTTYLYGPFISANGWAAASISGGSAIIHQKL